MKKNKYSDYGIGEVEEMTGVSQKQLRYWEEKRYIENIDRVVCGDRAYRRYSEDHIKLLKRIKLNLLRGYSLKGAVRNAQQNIEAGGQN